MTNSTRPSSPRASASSATRSRRRLAGELTEDEFRPLRLMNGLYLQLHAYMLRIAVPYGTLNSRQLRKLADIARKYDRGYGHFTTRQNLQFNWPALKDVPDILAELASVEMHAIQTSGNCIRNVTADHYAGVAADEIADPRPYRRDPAAMVDAAPGVLVPAAQVQDRRQRRAARPRGHPGARHRPADRARTTRASSASPSMSAAASAARRSSATRSATSCRERDLLAYAEAILRVYNLEGRRDNIYKARIKILVHEKGLEALRDAVEAEFAARDRARRSTLPAEEIARIAAYFAPPPLAPASRRTTGSNAGAARTPSSPKFFASNVVPHKAPGYAIVTVSLKPIGGVPGDASADQMDAVADLAEHYSHDEMRVTHEQNLILPHVALDDLTAVYDRLASVGLATPNAGLVSDIIACPGLDYCALATARSIPIAQRLCERFGDGARARAIGPLKIKISGCINACGHHHVGHIGILGLERAGEETYQITLGGSGDETASIGQIIGPGFSSETVVGAVETIVDTYMARAQRAGGGVPRHLSPPRPGAVQGGALPAQRGSRHLMSAHDVRLFGDAIAASRLEDRFAKVKASSLLRLAIEDLFPGRIALVSSFGADSVVLLHMVVADRPEDAGRVRRHRPAFRRDASLPRRALRAARPDEPRPRRARPRGRGGRGPGEVPVRQRPRPLLRHPQGAAAGARARRLRRLDHRPQKLPDRDAVARAAVRGRGRSGQGQSAGRLERDRSSRLHPRRRPAAPSAGRQGLSRRSAACPAPAASRPAKTRAPAAGAAAPRPNAASTPSR